MANTISNSFIQLWNREVKIAYQQKMAKVRAAVRVVTGIGSATYSFPTLGLVEANTKARNAPVDFLEPLSGVATATLADAYAPIMLDKLDEVKTNADIRSAYVRTSASALGRKTDDIIITAMDLATGTLPTTTGGFTFAKLNEANTAMNNADVDPDDRYMVISPKGLEGALSDEKFTNADYMTIRNLMAGTIKSAMGFNWIVSTRLPLTTTNRTCFVLNKQAVGLAVGVDVQTKISEEDLYVSFLINSWLSMGAVIIEQAGIYKVNVDEA